MKLIVGLGNPGPQYAQTRHNVGFQVVDRFVTRHQFTTRKMQLNAITYPGTYANERVVLARPMTYVNESGRAVGPLLRWLKAEVSDLLVIYDELDLPVGKIRIRPGGGSAGHNGMNSVIQHVGTDQFARMRLGIGKPIHGNGADFVLTGFSRDELPVIGEALDRAVGAVETFIERGLVAAMNLYNVDLSNS
jgi:PTH1 family peptidyl-tRNA hydrolase